jgi:hypothetical protein
LLIAAPSIALAHQSTSVRPGLVSTTIFAEEVDRLLTQMQSVRTAADVPAFVDTIPDQWRVVAGDQQVDVSTGWLTSTLRDAQKFPGDWPAVRQRVARRLRAMRDEARSFADGGGTDLRSRARHSIQGILSADEFQQSAASRWREDIQRRIGEWVEDVWNRLGIGRGSGRYAALVFAWIAALAAFGGLAFWLIRSLVEQPRGAVLGLEGSHARPPAREFALRALAEARAGNGREAVRCAYNAALVRLEEQGAWRVDDARTPREYLAILRTNDARHLLMLDLTQRFEQIWYGNRAVSSDDAPSVTAHLEGLGCLLPGERAI